MQPYKRKRRTRRDMIVLGGWLFADLLLGLAMLFAVANTVGQEPPTPTPTSTPNELETAQADFSRAQADNDATVAALEGQVADADTAAQQTQVAADQQAVQATELANEAATREAMTAQERATADAQATQDAAAAEGTIAALATEGASADSSVADVNADLATSVAQATEIANTVNAQSTEQAALEASATESANAGVNSQATLTASQNELATSQAQASSAQATAESAGAQVTNANATVEASNSQLENANATSAALNEQVQQNSLNPESVVITFQVDLNGVLGGDDEAVQAAQRRLDQAFAPYVEGQNCRVGFVLILSRSSDLGSGVELSEAIGALIQSEYPQLLPQPPDGSQPELAFEAIARPGTEPVGEVELQVFLTTGCQAARGASRPIAWIRPNPAFS